MDINHILVNGCPLCELFLNNDNITTHLHYPTKSTISSSDFIIITCKHEYIPHVIVRDHVETIPKELWGKILYICRNMFGNNIRIRIETRKIPDHWSAYVIKPKVY